MSDARAAVILVVSELAETYGKSLSSVAIAAYAEDLSTYPIDDIRTVAGTLRRSSEHWPRIPAWIDALKALRAAAQAPYVPIKGGPWCEECGDNGFVIVLCTAQRPCQRCQEHGRAQTAVVVRDEHDRPSVDVDGHAVLRWVEYDHRVARKCSCRPMNPNLNGTAQKQRKHGESPAGGRFGGAR
jgi:hypothetical protein